MLSEQERLKVQELLGNPLKYPEQFRDWLADYIATNIPLLPLSQVLGYQATQARVATSIVTEESTTSTLYTNLATVGPELTGIADGLYVLLFGSYFVSPGANVAYMSPSINGAAAEDVNSAAGLGDTQKSRGQMIALTNNGNNSILMKYRTSLGSSTTWRRRWLVALKVTQHD